MTTKSAKKTTVLVAAGPTREKIDPVRFISNYSTGTFGYEIAGEAARRGYKTVLVSGPVHLTAPSAMKLVRIESALEMRREVKKLAAQADCVIMAAAVCDWRPGSAGRQKIKRKKGATTLRLKENPDILKELGENKKSVLVGFALETENLEKNALEKLKKKNLDLVVANKLTKKSGLFGDRLTDVLMIDKYFRKTIYRRRTKRELAKIILDKALKFKI
ncbi:MAG: phosphopantothenoylcysteine decarboxylase [Candidatus Omnitrophica bacterium]|nr:phosphopantothenoylcysteine decarboxylase [Candidatus Omnitrophota bacterium]